MKIKKLNIGRDFSLDPSGRFYTDGEGSGEEFREDCLKKLVESLEPEEKLQIIIDDGVEAYGSSFLVEGFAGMVKYGYVTSQELLDKIEIHFTDEDFEFYGNKIKTYISQAKYNSQVYTPTK